MILEPPFDMNQDCGSCEYEVGMYNENRDESQTIPAEAHQFNGLQGSLDEHTKSTQIDTSHNYHVLKEHDVLATDRMLNTCSNELHRGSRSGEANLEVGGAQDEWNLYQGQCPSVHCGSTSFKTDDNKLSADFESDRSNSRVTCGCSKSEPDGCGQTTKEIFNDHSTYHSVPTSNGEINCMGFDWKDPEFQLHASSADVDKVRCIIRNIVRDWAPERGRM